MSSFLLKTSLIKLFLLVKNPQKDGLQMSTRFIEQDSSQVPVGSVCSSAAEKNWGNFGLT